MNLIKNSISISHSLLPKAKMVRSSKNKFFHFAFGYKKNKLIGIGQNNPEKTHTKAMIIANRFNIEQQYYYLHAETDLISRLWGKVYLDNSMVVVLVRLNKRGELRNSRPCNKCSQILKCLDINKIYWSTPNGFKQS